jgi:hypothetical protein
VFSPGVRGAPINFASTTPANPAYNRAPAPAGANDSPDAFVEYFLGRLSPAPFDGEPLDALKAYLVDGGAWTGATAQLQTKAAGLARLIVGSAEYQLM